MLLVLLGLLTTILVSSVQGATVRNQESASVYGGKPNLVHLRREQSLAAADLQVGTQSGQSNVVSGFELVPTWVSGEDLAASAPVTVPSTTFYLRATGGDLQLTRAAVEPESLPHLQISFDGDLAKQLAQDGQVTLKQNKERRLVVAYDCRSQGEAALSLTLEIEGQSPVQIPLKKVCGGEKNTALTVTAGTASQGEKVVIMGIPKWDELTVVGVRPVSTKFRLFVDPLSEQGAQMLGKPTATGIGACAAQAVIPNGALFSSGNTELAAGQSLDVDVNYRCFRHGKCVVSMKVPFHPDMAPYQPLRWSWTKLCGGEALGVDVELPEARRLIATDGSANASYAAQWIADTDVSEHKIRLINDATRSLEPELKIRNLNVRCLDTRRCTSSLSESVPKVLASGSPLDLNVQYVCHSSGSSIVRLVLSLEDHDPVVTTWAKDCRAFGDSFLGCVLFMLCTCACCALACVGFIKMFFETPRDARGKPLLEGEFIEDENLTAEDIQALDNYEEFYGLQKGAASIEQVKDSVLGVSGWAAKATEEGAGVDETPASA